MKIETYVSHYCVCSYGCGAHLVYIKAISNIFGGWMCQLTEEMTCCTLGMCASLPFSSRGMVLGDQHILRIRQFSITLEVVSVFDPVDGAFGTGEASLKIFKGGYWTLVDCDS